MSEIYQKWYKIVKSDFSPFSSGPCRRGGEGEEGEEEGEAFHGRPLVEEVDRMQNYLIENPHCILAGVYDTKGIICTNLVGCFAFKIFGRVAPLGFEALLENA